MISVISEKEKKKRFKRIVDGKIITWCKKNHRLLKGIGLLFLSYLIIVWGTVGGLVALAGGNFFIAMLVIHGLAAVCCIIALGMFLAKKAVDFINLNKYNN